MKLKCTKTHPWPEGVGRIAGLVAALVAVAAVGAMGDAQADYQMLFGQEEKQAAATLGTRDDVTLAAKLLAAAGSLKDSPDLQRLLYEKAYELGMKGAGGAGTAIEALDRLDKVDPKGATGRQENRLAAYRQRYAAAGPEDRARAGRQLLRMLMRLAEQHRRAARRDEARRYYSQALMLAGVLESPMLGAVRAAVREMDAESREASRIAAMTAAVDRNPSDIGARRALLLHHLLERDDPAAAAGLLTDDLDEATRTYVPLAAKPVEDLAEGALVEMAEWYRSLAPKAPTAGKINALRRGRGYYARYLGVHEEKDAARLKATLGFRQIQSELSALGVQPGDEPLREIRFEDEKLTKAHAAAVRFLRRTQQPGGHWRSDANGTERYTQGLTGLVVCALLDSGADASDPRVAKALAWLTERDTSRTYSLAWRTMAFGRAYRANQSYLPQLKHDTEQLVRSTRGGGFGYSARGVPEKQRIDLSNTRAALAAVSAGDDAGVAVPNAFWQTEIEFWRRRQEKGGGWAYRPGSEESRPRGSMTAAGIAALFACHRHLYGSLPTAGLNDPRLEAARKGVAWLDKRFSGSLELGKTEQGHPYIDPKHSLDVYYYLYGVSRAGLACGRRSFGGANWLDAGAKAVLRFATEDGGFRGKYGKTASTAMFVLFLNNGARAQFLPE